MAGPVPVACAGGLTTWSRRTQRLACCSQVTARLAGDVQTDWRAEETSK
jgi:hypothetical protein